MKKKLSLIVVVILICSAIIMMLNRFQSNIPHTEGKGSSVQENLIIYDETEERNIISVSKELEGKSVAEVTKEVLRELDIDYKLLGTGDIVYFSMIDDIKEKSKGALSGWCYFVNGSKPSISSGVYKLKAGDIVEWKFLLNGIQY